MGATSLPGKSVTTGRIGSAKQVSIRGLDWRVPLPLTDTQCNGHGGHPAQDARRVLSRRSGTPEHVECIRSETQVGSARDRTATSGQGAR